MAKMGMYVLRAAVALLCILPPKMAELLVAGATWLRVWLKPKDLRLACANLSRVFGFPKDNFYARRTARQFMLCQSLALVTSLRAIFRPQAVHIQGGEELRERLQRAESAERGVIIITAHLGSWEYVARAVADRTDKKFFCLAKPARLAALQQFLLWFRPYLKAFVLNADSTSILRDMIKALNQRDYLGFVMDQKPKGRQGPRVSFLGQDTEFVTGPASLAKKFSCPVVGVFAVRSAPNTLRLLSYDVWGPDQDQDMSLEALTQKMATSLEHVIHLYPEQWTWNYRRWL